MTVLQAKEPACAWGLACALPLTHVSSLLGLQICESNEETLLSCSSRNHSLSWVLSCGKQRCKKRAKRSNALG